MRRHHTVTYSVVWTIAMILSSIVCDGLPESNRFHESSSMLSSTNMPSVYGTIFKKNSLDSNSNQEAPVCPNIYVTINGDDCNSVAKRFNFSTASLLEINYPVLDCTNLTPGSPICIYCNSRFPICHPTTPLPPNVPPPPPLSSCQKTYTVVAGDSCWQIAATLKTTVDNIQRLNNWLSCYTQYIYPTQILCVG
ncbi:hypothetical protein QVD99_005778 [Batrachochytrium dendrobatidis]|nr:hypothetical protein O5D80_000741 [Batrachochytrium dendrobatidis]KAK5667666.1 hypothetical protein QVD99_005778 [Batrachochytrium dendrobatidis]